MLIVGDFAGKLIFDSETVAIAEGVCRAVTGKGRAHRHRLGPGRKGK